VALCGSRGTLPRALGHNSVCISYTLFEYPSVSAYVKIKFVLIRVMVGELCSYTQTIGPSDNDFFMNHRLTIIVENELDVKDITDVYRDVLREEKTYSS
jgi:hypothetical protein